MRKPLRVLAAVTISAVAVAALATAACRPKQDPNFVKLNGRLEAPTVDLAPKVAGRVVEVKVKEGRSRESRRPPREARPRRDSAFGRARYPGIEIAEAKYRDMQAGSREAEIAQAESDLADKRAAAELARKELERQEALLSKKVGTQRDTDTARTSLERAVANVKMAADRLQLLREGSRRDQTEQARFDVERARTVLKQSETTAAEAEIRAPADGVVLHRIAEPGLLLSPSQPALTMAFTGRLYVRTFIPETKLGVVRTSLPATVTVDSFPGKSFPAHVTEISPDAEFTPKPVETREERVNQVYAAKVDLDAGWNAPLVPGQPAEVSVKVGP